jgi:exonuclease SbcC
VDAQLNESLAALAAYQSHLDAWQQQLAREREELHGQWERLAQERAATASTDISDELKAARDEIHALTETLTSRGEELRAVRAQLEQDRSTAEFNQARLSELTSELSAARGEITTLTQNLLASAEDLRAERQKIEQNESSADYQEERLAEVTTELNAARDKISALTTMLLSRTEELRTLDVRRAEVSTELELARVRERELKSALDELRETREWEHAQWAEESRLLRELVERRMESAEGHPTDRPEHQPSGTGPDSKNAEAPHNPVFSSVIEQFGKLRQQRAMLDRTAAKKAR